MNRFLWPLIGFIVLVVLLAVGLNLDPREVPSPLVGKPAPAFSLSKLGSDEKFSPQDMQGKVWLLNVWSTWCVSCRQEHPMLVQMAQSKTVTTCHRMVNSLWGLRKPSAKPRPTVCRIAG